MIDGIVLSMSFDNVCNSGESMRLALAHRRLDKAVFAAHEWQADLVDEEALERLLVPNLERAGASDGRPD